jgi:hypothetical protein
MRGGGSKQIVTLKPLFDYLQASAGPDPGPQCRRSASSAKAATRVSRCA